MWFSANADLYADATQVAALGSDSRSDVNRGEYRELDPAADKGDPLPKILRRCPTSQRGRQAPQL